MKTPAERLDEIVSNDADARHAALIRRAAAEAASDQVLLLELELTIAEAELGLV